MLSIPVGRALRHRAGEELRRPGPRNALQTLLGPKRACAAVGLVPLTMAASHLETLAGAAQAAIDDERSPAVQNALIAAEDAVILDCKPVPAG